MVSRGNDLVFFVFTVAAGTLAIYNSFETLFLIIATFKRYNTPYFWSLVGCAVGIFLFAVGFMDLFFEIYDPGSTIWRPLIVLTIGWYGMVTGFALVMYSRLSLLSIPDHIIRYVRMFIIYNIIFSHFPTTVLTFGANIVGTYPWVEGYRIMEKIQMTCFAIQEVSLGLLYLKYIRQSRLSEKIGSMLVRKTSRVNITVLFLDVSMLILEYIDLYSYQIMLKVVVYSIKLKLEFYILSILTRALENSHGPMASIYSPSVTSKEDTNWPWYSFLFCWTNSTVEPEPESKIQLSEGGSRPVTVQESI